MQTPDETGQFETQMAAHKARHGCVTAWLVLMIIANSCVALAYFFMSDKMSAAIPKLTTPVSIALGVIGVLNVIFSVMLLQWKKIAFWGFAVTTVITFAVNIYIGLPIIQSIFGFAGIAILYGILQMKENNRTGWENLE